MELVSGVKECLGRNASNIEAGTTKGPSLLNANGLESTLAGLNSSDVAYTLIKSKGITYLRDLLR